MFDKGTLVGAYRIAGVIPINHMMNYTVQWDSGRNVLVSGSELINNKNSRAGIKNLTTRGNVLCYKDSCPKRNIRFNLHRGEVYSVEQNNFDLLSFKITRSESNIIGAHYEGVITIFGWQLPYRSVHVKVRNGVEFDPVVWSIGSNDWLKYNAAGNDFSFNGLSITDFEIEGHKLRGSLNWEEYRGCFVGKRYSMKLNLQTGNLTLKSEEGTVYKQHLKKG